MKILFTGGGSAGHVSPNIALIRDLIEEGGHELAYIGGKGIEKELVKGLVPFFEIAPPKFIRKFTLQNLKIPFCYFRAKKQAKAYLRSFAPDAVFSKGGYVALPVVRAANALKIPSFTHESDLTLGLANRLMAKKCKAVFTSFPETAKALPNGIFSGSPIRKELLSGDEEKAREKYGFSGDKKILLVFGGGSGSKILNDAIKENLTELLSTFDILHISGKGNSFFVKTKGYYQTEYETDMASAYAAADFVLCRGGSNTLFELIALKKPALILPLEGQTRGDQKQNADYFSKRGLCHVLYEKDIYRLPSALLSLANDKDLKPRLERYSIGSGNYKILSTLQKELCKKP